MNTRLLFVLLGIFAFLAGGAGIALSLWTQKQSAAEVGQEIAEQQLAALNLAVTAVREELIAGNIRLAKMRLWSLAQSGTFDGYEIEKNGRIEVSVGLDNLVNPIYSEIPVKFGEAPNSPIWGIVRFARSGERIEKMVAKVMIPFARTSTVFMLMMVTLIVMALVTMITNSKHLSLVLASFIRGDQVVVKKGLLNLFWGPLIRALQKSSEDAEKMRTKIEEAKRHESVAKATGMLAHDVRKPFTMLKMGLDRLTTLADDPKAMREMAFKVRDHVGKAFDQVNGLIADLLEVSGDKTNLVREPVSLHSVLDQSLAMVFRYQTEALIDFDVSISHTHKIEVDSQKLQRVFSNILDNARQAMKNKGTIWIRSTEISSGEGLGSIQLAIGNTGSYIKPEDIAQLFEAFFTKGKKGGTGLGLAICQKIILAHGGSIRCESHAERGTEFILTLPLSNEIDNESALGWPTSAKEIRDAFEKSLIVENKTVKNEDPTLQASIHDATKVLRSLSRKFTILLIDDEPVYTDALMGILNNLPATELLDIAVASTPQQALEICQSKVPDLVISDADLGVGNLSGFDLIANLKQIAPNSGICMHSNRSLQEDYKRAINAGAIAFLPKPMSPAHLLMLIARQGDQMVCKQQIRDVDASKIAIPVPRTPHIIAIDDDIFVLESWRKSLKGNRVDLYTTPSKLLADIESKKVDPSTIDLAITDYYFDNEPEFTGASLAIDLRAKGFKKIAVATDAVLSDRDKNIFDGIVPKDKIANAAAFITTPL